MSDMKLCECGCGQPTALATQTNRARGAIKGQPVRFIPGHHLRLLPHPKRTSPARVAALFWAKIEKTDGCWLWRGQFQNSGYGTAYDGTRSPILAHRFAWIQEHGPIPVGLEVCHRCDNRACVRAVCTRPGCTHDGPDCESHLFLGTRAQNMADAKAKGRTHLGERNGGAKLAAAQVLELRSRATSGESFKTLATAFGISASQVSRIVRGKKWAHLQV